MERERLQQVWQHLDHLETEDPNVPGTDETSADREKAIESLPARRSFASNRRPRKNVRSFQWLTSAAALSLILFAVMIWLWRTPVVIKAPLGQQVITELPDGSTVTLNSGSRIEYARRFESWPLISNAKRRVFLQGEAFFEIQKKERPFIVESFNAQIRVLGTSFNVWSRAHDKMPETRVTLSSGSVLVTPIMRENQPATLTEEGQMVRVVTREDGAGLNHANTTPIETVPIEIVPIEYVTAWRSNGFSVQKMSVGSVISEVERRYVLNIALDPAIDQTLEMSFFFKEKPVPEKLLESICLSIGCQYSQTSNGFSIFPIASN